MSTPELEHMTDSPISETPELSTTAKGDFSTVSGAPFDLLYAKPCPMGFTVYINSGQSGTSNGLFALRVTPRVPNFYSPATRDGIPQIVNPMDIPKGNAFLADRCAYEHPFTPLADSASAPDKNILTTAFQPVRGICAVQDGDEPLFSRVSRLYRGWTGGIMYRVKVVSNFTNQGYMRWCIVNGRPNVKSFHNNRVGTTPELVVPTSLFPAAGKLLNGLADTTTNNWISSDLSSKKHVDIMVPYERVLSFVDEHVIRRDYGKNNPINYPGLPFTEQYIVVQLGGLLTSGQGGQVQLVFEYCPAPDFTFVKPICPFILDYMPALYKFEVDTDDTTKTGLITRKFTDARWASFVVGDHGTAPATWPRTRVDTGTEYPSDGGIAYISSQRENAVLITDITNTIIRAAGEESQKSDLGLASLTIRDDEEKKEPLIPNPVASEPSGSHTPRSRVSP